MCGAGQQARWLDRQCNLKPDERQRRFAQWWTSTPERQTALGVAKSLYARHGWLTLWGGNGSGKSFLATAIVAEGLNIGLECRYWSMAAVLDHLRQAFDPKSGQGWSNLFDDLIDCPLLVIDEAHVFNPTPWAYERFRLLAEERYRTASVLATVWVMNVAPGSMDGDAYFLASRMGQFPVIELTGDVRPQLQEPF